MIAKADGRPEAVAEDQCAAIGEARYHSRFVVTSLLEPDAQTVYKEMYCDRGEAKNWIKEQKNDLFLDRCSSSRWNVNALRLRLIALAHIIYRVMKHRLENLTVSVILRRSRPSTLRRAPVPDPGARDGIHAADSSGVRVRLPVLEGFPVDLAQPGTDVKARFNREPADYTQ